MDNDNDAGFSTDEVEHDHRITKSGGKKEDGSKGDGKDRKGVINRVNRACNNCRRMKMRCVGADDPPCKRCRNGGLECVMEKPGKPGSGDGNIGEDRIRSLESQVSAMQNTLSDLVTTLRAGMSSGNSNGSAPTPIHAHTTTPDYAPSVGPVPIPTSTLHGLMAPPSNSPTMNPSAMDNYGRVPMPNPGNPFASTHIVSNLPQQANYGNTFSVSPHNNATQPPRRPVVLDENLRRQSVPVGFHQGQSTWPLNHLAEPDPHTRHMSLPPSRAGSMGPEDILGPEEIINPLGEMSNMAGLVEAAVERAREEQAKSTSVDGETPMKRSGSEMERSGSGPEDKKALKRARFVPPHPVAYGPVIYEYQNLPPIAIAPGSKAGPKRQHTHAFPDAISEGLVSEQEGREMFKIYYMGSSNFIPCFDPKYDTWESLRARSPFGLTTIIFVGARVRDGGGPPSAAQSLCRSHAEKIAVNTLFHPVQRIEAVQSMILLSAYRDSGWLPGGHAVRLALDMGINRSFLHLLRTGMGKGKSESDLEQERSLVVQSRTWLCLYLMEHQMAYGTGRPAIIREDETIHQCRRLLEHPLSIPSDARLVSTVEMTALRSPLHIELTSAPDLPIAEGTLKRLKQANTDFDAWERYWDRVLSDRFGKGKGDFFRESLVIQRQYAELFVNSQLLRGIREPADVAKMPEEKRVLAIRAMRNAQKCLDICLHGDNYRNGLKYAVHYTHVCAAFAASFLIRIARLFPHELNLKKTAKDIEELANVLSQIPAGRYARSLRLILRKARRQKVIPAPSTMPSPNKLAAALPQVPGHPGGTPVDLPSALSAFSPSQLVNPSYYPSPAPGGVPNMSPSSAAVLMNATNQLINDSPSSAELFEFDSLFAQETMERAGIPLGDDNQLPLFLDGQSLGSSANQLDMAPYVGLEQFFLPQEVDNRLANPGNAFNDANTGEGFAGGEGAWW
ncbi:uncharacterized protein I303_103659 [Kwoniella dejecticola CBS 10117]|uniref:Zn(2)-C6 fungal-type domain-containing protein n=1 Tax=Kwoniella dejecticola CBS 10117 TaxID=1296121 RepID=A0A1A6A7D0_9TREE|nr:uncharacterized protein I303_03680 [Kwoniella dejecticola CBS 10117]OBR85965.1 hypothetical protein I303_03680 [Kwoniella dejecticola CBS 10117]